LLDSVAHELSELRSNVAGRLLGTVAHGVSQSPDLRLAVDDLPQHLLLVVVDLERHLHSVAHVLQVLGQVVVMRV
jgi:hypothetical protein